MSKEYECSKHPEDLMGLNPKEFANKFVKTNYFYQKACFKELIKEYEEEIKGDKERGRIQLYSGLEELVSVFKGPVNEAINKVCKSCKKYLKDNFSSNEY